jgi:hypothetical protein
MELFEEKLSYVSISYSYELNDLKRESLESTTYFNFLKVREVYAIAVAINILPIYKYSYWSRGDWLAVMGYAILANFVLNIATVSLTSLTPGKKTSICSSCFSFPDN